MLFNPKLTKMGVKNKNKNIKISQKSIDFSYARRYNENIKIVQVSTGSKMPIDAVQRKVIKK